MGKKKKMGRYFYDTQVTPLQVVFEAGGGDRETRYRDNQWTKLCEEGVANAQADRGVKNAGPPRGWKGLTTMGKRTSPARGAMVDVRGGCVRGGRGGGWCGGGGGGGGWGWGGPATGGERRPVVHKWGGGNKN